MRDPHLERFVLAELPSPPARVLEVGCGAGELAMAMDTAGYAVTAIDPEAPVGEIFERVGLEDFATEERFDAVVASAALHHLPDLALAAERRERDAEPIPEDFAEWRRAAAEHLTDIHSADSMLEELARSFAQRSFTRVPYLYRYELPEAIEPLERELIDLGAIQATGFRYVGEPR
ncbi:MAG TPA: methyltransferase domain-containing protein [Solirubrobacterales bacterium]|nr:methyltransferase domain-containing protein [Solirubrobacterales bacterium]